MYSVYNMYGICNMYRLYAACKTCKAHKTVLAQRHAKRLGESVCEVLQKALLSECFGDVLEN